MLKEFSIIDESSCCVINPKVVVPHVVGVDHTNAIESARRQFLELVDHFRGTADANMRALRDAHIEKFKRLLLSESDRLLQETAGRSTQVVKETLATMQDLVDRVAELASEHSVKMTDLEEAHRRISAVMAGVEADKESLVRELVVESAKRLEEISEGTFSDIENRLRRSVSELVAKIQEEISTVAVEDAKTAAIKELETFVTEHADKLKYTILSQLGVATVSHNVNALDKFKEDFTALTDSIVSASKANMSRELDAQRATIVKQTVANLAKEASQLVLKDVNNLIVATVKDVRESIGHDMDGLVAAAKTESLKNASLEVADHFKAELDKLKTDLPADVRDWFDKKVSQLFTSIETRLTRFEEAEVDRLKGIMQNVLNNIVQTTVETTVAETRATLNERLKDSASQVFAELKAKLVKESSEAVSESIKTNVKRLEQVQLEAAKVRIKQIVRTALKTAAKTAAASIKDEVTKELLTGSSSVKKELLDGIKDQIPKLLANNEDLDALKAQVHNHVKTNVSDLAISTVTTKLEEFLTDDETFSDLKTNMVDDVSEGIKKEVNTVADTIKQQIVKDINQALESTGELVKTEVAKTAKSEFETMLANIKDSAVISIPQDLKDTIATELEKAVAATDVSNDIGDIVDAKMTEYIQSFNAKLDEKSGIALTTKANEIARHVVANTSFKAASEAAETVAKIMKQSLDDDIQDAKATALSQAQEHLDNALTSFKQQAGVSIFADIDTAQKEALAKAAITVQAFADGKAAEINKATDAKILKLYAEINNLETQVKSAYGILDSVMTKLNTL